MRQGFTLIELSIVLVVIGLVIGGVLVGRTLVEAAALRSQISQLNSYNSAVNAFRDKYGELPGDIQPVLVTHFGFTAAPTRAGAQGQGDSNGVIEGYTFGVSAVFPLRTQGEPAWFWEDLTTNGGQIPGNFNTATNASLAANATGSSIDLYLPQARIGNGNYVYVYSVGGFNYFGLSAVTSILISGEIVSNVALTVAQAHDIDGKIDDGVPDTGNVTVNYLNTGLGLSPHANPDTAATCYNGATHAYSVTVNNGTSTNCGLSFRFQ